MLRAFLSPRFSCASSLGWGRISQGLSAEPPGESVIVTVQGAVEDEGWRGRGERLGSGTGMREMSMREGPGRGTGREERPPRDAGGLFPSRLRGEEDFFRKRDADAV